MTSLRLVAGMLAAALLAVACVDEFPTEPSTRSATALRWQDDEVDLSGLQLAVGSKPSAEQQVLGHLAIESLAAAGADVIDQTALGGTLELRDAQLGGLVDLYWEYTGTGWVELLREIGPSDDAEVLAAAVAETDLDENAIAWLPPAPANSTYAIARGSDLPEELDIDTVSGLGDLLAERVDGAALCVPAGGRFVADPQGFIALSDALELRIRDGQVLPIARDDLIEVTEAGLFCPFAQVERTSVELLGADLALLDDDVGAFLVRNPAVTVRAEVLAEFPDIEPVLAPVAAALTDEVLRELNAAVARDRRGPRTVAREWLVDEGLADF